LPAGNRPSRSQDGRNPGAHDAGVTQTKAHRAVGDGGLGTMWSLKMADGNGRADDMPRPRCSGASRSTTSITAGQLSVYLRMLDISSAVDSYGH